MTLRRYREITLPEKGRAESQKKIPEPHQCGSGIIVRLSTALKKDGCLAAKIYASSAGAAADSGVSSVAGAV